MYYVWASALVLGNFVAWLLSLVALPGNWIILGLTAIFALLIQPDGGPGVTWWTVGALAVLATLGEIVEFAASAAGAKQRGASRRAILLAIVGTVIGSLAGAAIGVPVPLVGPIIGAVGGGAFGAFVGAYFGETWKGKSSAESLDVGQAALVGRLLGTIGKLALGAVMCVIVIVDLFVN